jgi:hypothetical protein
VKRCLKWICVIVLATFALLQLTNLGHTNPAVTAGHDLLTGTNRPPAEIATLLRSACYDCHSYETRWPWYGHVAPVSWWINSHVSDARDVLNFSEWPNNDPQKAARKLNHIGDTVRDGDMPLPSYLKIHTAARLTEQQRDALSAWAFQQSDRLKGLTDDLTTTNSPKAGTTSASHEP